MVADRRYWRLAEGTLRRMNAEARSKELFSEELAMIASRLNSPTIIADIDTLIGFILELREIGVKLHGNT